MSVLLVLGTALGAQALVLRCPRHCASARAAASMCAPDAIFVAGIEAFLGGMDGSNDDWDDEVEEDVELEARFQEELAAERGYPARALAEQAFLGRGEPLPLVAESQGAAAAAAAISDAGPGVVRLARALSPELARELRAFALSELAAAQSGGPAGQLREARLSNVLAPEVRWDVRLRMTSVVRRALRELLGGDAPLGGALELAAGGPGAELWEMAALVSAPGAAAQILHSDCDGAPEPPLLHTAFVALQPVTRALGPTRWLPGSQSDVSVERALQAAVGAGGGAADEAGPRDDGDGAAPPRSYVGLLETGDAALYDSRTLHCGGANSATADGGADGDGQRVLFYTTFRHAGRSDAGSNPAARSILARYGGRVTLGMLRDESGAGFDGYWLRPDFV